MSTPSRPLSAVALPYGLLAVCLILAVGYAAVPQIILAAPTEPTMGFVQRIFYFHVPVAWLAMLGALTSGLASAIYLSRGSEKADEIAVSAAELAVIFGLCAIVSGPLWARKAWGVFWQWDVRLTTTALLWIIFVAYLFVRRYGGPGSSRLAAGLALFGAADVPLIYISVSIWRTIHPKTSVVPTLDRGMRPAFWLSMLLFSTLFFVLLSMRRRLERARKELNTLHLDADEAGLLDD